MPKSIQARENFRSSFLDNFFGLFAAPKEEELTLMAPETYAAIIAGVQKLAEPFSGQVDAFLIHAPDRLGRNHWYFFETERPPTVRMFKNASPYTTPKGVFTSKTPWKEMRANLNTFRKPKPEQVQFAVIDAISGKTEGPLSLAAIAKRNPRRRMARRNGTALADRLSELLGLLHTAKSVAWVAHWNAKGPNFYGTHLMFQRIYEELDEPIDELGERYVAYTRSPVKYHAFRGEDVDVPTDAQAAANLLDSILGVAQQTSDMARSIANREVSGRSAAGLDDYLMALNNTLDTFRYLLYRYAGE